MAKRHQKDETCASKHSAHEGGSERHQPTNCIRSFGDALAVALHALATQHQTYTLTYTSSDAVQHTRQGHLERQVLVMGIVVSAAGQHRHGYTADDHHHRENSLQRHRLTQYQPTGNGRGNGRQGHEQLTETGTDDDIGTEKADVPEGVAYQTREA